MECASLTAYLVGFLRADKQRMFSFVAYLYLSIITPTGFKITPIGVILELYFVI